MVSSTLAETTAREIMRPLPPFVTLQTPAIEALDRMRRENADFLPVVAPDTEKFLGIVLRRALELGCVGMGHKPEECRIFTHLKADVDFCFEEESAEEVMSSDSDEPTSSRLDKGARVRRSLPVIVVDERKVPIGMLERR